MHLGWGEGCSWKERTAVSTVGEEGGLYQVVESPGVVAGDEFLDGFSHTTVHDFAPAKLNYTLVISWVG